MEIFLKAGYNVVAVAGQPRLPYFDRGSRQRAAAARCWSACTCNRRAADRRQRQRRVLSHGARCRAADAGHAGAAGCFAGAVRQRPAHAVRRGRAGLRRGRARRRRCRDSPKTCSGSDGDVVSLFTNHPEARRHRCLQPGAVRPVRRGLGSRNRLRRPHEVSPASRLFGGQLHRRRQLQRDALQTSRTASRDLRSDQHASRTAIVIPQLGQLVRRCSRARLADLPRSEARLRTPNRW